MGPLSSDADVATAGRAEGVVVQQQSGQRHDEEGRKTQRPRAVSPSAVEWGDLVTSLRSLHVERQQAQGCGTAPTRPRPKPVRSRSDQTFDHCTRGRGKRGYDECVSSNLARPPRHPSDGSSSDSSGSDSEDTAGLGAPPLLPPTLKRARACSFSPTSSTARNFSTKISSSNTPRQ